MKFHKEGYPTLLVTILFSTIIISIAKLAFPEFAIAHWFAYVLSGFLLIVVLQFFRHPSRVHTLNDQAIIAPADGEVVVIEETEEGEYFNGFYIHVAY
jgi:phosphatidylserine decarboxylase